MNSSMIYGVIIVKIIRKENENEKKLRKVEVCFCFNYATAVGVN